MSLCGQSLINRLVVPLPKMDSSFDASVAPLSYSRHTKLDNFQLNFSTSNQE